MPRPVDNFIFESQDDNEFVNTVPTQRKKNEKQKDRKRKIKSNYWDDMSSFVEETVMVDNDLSDILNQDDLIDVSTNSDVNTVFSENDSFCLEDMKTKAVNISLKTSKKKKHKTKDSNGDSSEEERWLHAIEFGKLDEVDDELKKIKPKDPKLMTARQRAILERRSEKDTLNEQCTSQNNKDKLTPEMEKEKAKKLQKRKQLADEKRENDKKKTMERLLRKSESKSTKLNSRMRTKRTDPTVLYLNNVQSITINLPSGFDFPIENKKSNPPPEIQKCGFKGCKNVKKYTCSTTGIPLCSLKCYTLNSIQNERKPHIVCI